LLNNSGNGNSKKLQETQLTVEERPQTRLRTQAAELPAPLPEVPQQNLATATGNAITLKRLQAMELVNMLAGRIRPHLSPPRRTQSEIDFSSRAHGIAIAD